MLDDIFDSEESEIETTVTDEQTRADEKYIAKELARKGYNAAANFAVGCYKIAVDTAIAAPKALCVDLPKGLLKTAAATAFQAIPMWPSHRHRILKYFCGEEAKENSYAWNGSILQLFGEMTAAGLLFHYGVSHHSVFYSNISVVLGADILCKIIAAGQILTNSNSKEDTSLIEDLALKGWGQGIMLVAGGFLYMGASTAKDLFNSARGKYKQRVHNLAKNLQHTDNQE
ncbi:MAG: hypothetical protein KAT43_04230 [Nanoarchaeota archaeon]|nr:hypothetical protein [Nanoarchaeota archaeon]